MLVCRRAAMLCLAPPGAAMLVSRQRGQLSQTAGMQTLRACPTAHATYIGQFLLEQGQLLGIVVFTAVEVGLPGSR